MVIGAPVTFPYIRGMPPATPLPYSPLEASHGQSVEFLAVEGPTQVESATKINTSKSSRSRICGQPGAFDGRWFLQRTLH